MRRRGSPTCSPVRTPAGPEALCELRGPGEQRSLAVVVAHDDEIEIGELVALADRR